MGEKHLKRIARVQQAATMLAVPEIALELETEAFAFYSEAAQFATIPDVKQTFEYLSGFERGHMRLVEEMIAAETK